MKALSWCIGIGPIICELETVFVQWICNANCK